ncbi:MAG: efflux RND transporter periplasmic adaptor subunit, partial [Pseudomonadota bacterium]
LTALATGTIQPRREITITPRVSGVVDQLFIIEGDVVESGAMLARITVVPDAVTLNSARASYETARISASNARVELERRRKLFEDNLISKDEFERYAFDYDIKRQEAASAQSNLELIRDGSNEQGSVSNEIRSTVTGTVLDIPVKEGESVTETNNFNEGTTIASIADMNDMIFVGVVDESEVGRIREGMAVNLTIGAIDNVIFPGTLEFISPKGEQSDGTVKFEIRAAIDASNAETIRAGYSANAEIELDRRDGVVVVNERALLFSDNKNWLLPQVVDGQFERREVQTGLSDGVNIEIVDGISAGTTVRVP